MCSHAVTAMQFRTTNAPADFESYIINAIRETLDAFESSWLDSISIYSDSEEEHVGHVTWIVQHLLKAGLYLKPEKCEFHHETVRYLWLLITPKGISMDEEKIQTVWNWSREKKTNNWWPNNFIEVQQFVGFCNCYQQFILEYSSKAEPPTRFTKKNERFVLESEQQLVFETIIAIIITAPALRHFDYKRDVISETDSSDYISAGVLSHWDDQWVLHPEAYFSKKHTPAECNYHIYDIELMAIIEALEEWRPECEGAVYLVQLITDHKNLEYFVTKKLLNWKQAQWSEFVTRYNYHLVHRPGESNGKGNVLTRRPEDLPEGGHED